MSDQNMPMHTLSAHDWLGQRWLLEMGVISAAVISVLNPLKAFPNRLMCKIE